MRAAAAAATGAIRKVGATVAPVKASKQRVGSWRGQSVQATRTHPALVRAERRKKNKQARRARRVNR